MTNLSTLAAGAVTTTLLAHRRDWIHRHDELVELHDRRGRRTVRVEFTLPKIAWAAVPAGTPVIVPLGMRPKAAGSVVDAYDENDERVAVLPDGWSAEIAAAGLLAMARAAGSEPDADLLRLIREVVDGAAAGARAALEEMALGESDAARWAWMHAPFRTAARSLADRRMVLVVIADCDRPRTLTYVYDERVAHLRAGGGGLGGRLARALAWDGATVPLSLPHLRDARRHELRVDAGAREPEVEIDEPTATARVRITAATAAAVRWGGPMALLTALLLSAAAATAVALDWSSALLAVVALPALPCIALARRRDRHFPAELVRGARALLALLAVVSVTAAVLLATVEPATAVAVGGGALAVIAWVVTALLAETRRRARR